VENLRALQERWSGLLPADMAANTRPAGLANGCLTILATSGAWATRLRHQRTAILGQLRRDPHLFAVRDLRVVVAPAAATATRPGSRRPG